jgi:hypothetical protein
MMPVREVPKNERREALNTIGTPVRQVYASYKAFMASQRRGKGPTLAEHLEKQFGISHSQWGRMKVVYETAMAGDAYALELVEQIDNGDLTPAEARTRLDRHHASQAPPPDNIPTRVHLGPLYQTAIRTNAYAETVAAALAHGVQVNTSGLSAEEQADCVQQIRDAGNRLKAIARALTSIDIGR